MRIRDKRNRRDGAAAVETAVVMVPLLMIIMGIFEYSWVLMNRNVLNNAARDGCRYALVNNTSTTIASDVTNLVTTRMGGQTKNFTNFTVTVSGTRDGVPMAVNDLGPGDRITVCVSGNYKFLNVIPFISCPTLSMSSSVTAICEGGT
jgi:Flp pilus assembly protein TadG